MEETQNISTTPETSVEKTTQEVTSENTQPENQTIEQNVTNEPDNTVIDGTEITEETPKATPTVEATKDWEKIAKDNQASFTKVSQELAQLKKQLQPQLVDDKGKINPDFENRYRFDVDNKEFLAYDSLARQLNGDERNTVEALLNEAKQLYNPQNKRAYEAKMAQVKDYFRADIVEQIAIEKRNLTDKMQSEFDKAIRLDREQRANSLAQKVDEIPELKTLLYQDSENYSPEIHSIVKQMFDLTGGVDLDMTTKAIQKIKEIGVKEYLVKQEAEKTKANATVPTGETVVQKQASGIPTRDEMIANPSLYQKAVKKFGMEKVDAVIMKG
ncbi:MAG: hypothetical protein MJ180_00230 [Candidatus Gastranaerophilales bacterium]|nr:hypothetical protein [Candidatus Gastranaerophilales bacterium]